MKPSSNSNQPHGPASNVREFDAELTQLMRDTNGHPSLAQVCDCGRALRQAGWQRELDDMNAGHRSEDPYFRAVIERNIARHAIPAEDVIRHVRQSVNSANS